MYVLKQIHGIVASARNRLMAFFDLRRAYRQFGRNPQPMWIFAIDTLKILAVNDAAVRAYGYSRQELLSMHIDDFRPPQDRPVLYNIARNLPHSANSGKIWRHIRKDKTIVNVTITSWFMIYQGKKCMLVLAREVHATGR